MPNRALTILQSLIVYIRSQQTTAQKPNLDCCLLFFTVHELRISITFLNSGKKIKIRLFHDMKITCNTNFSVHKSSFIGNGYAHPFTY